MQQSQTAFGCVITRNRLAYARTLFESVRQHHPGAACFALLIDEVEGSFDPAAEAFEVLELSRLAIDDLDSIRFKYTAFELCCALKPVLLRHLLTDRGFGSAIYFDIDIMVLAPLDRLLERFASADILLTPHVTTDLPSDGRKPDDALVLKSGIFNLGFIGVRNSDNGLAFLAWWWKKLRKNCVVDHFNGFFVDQKYVDLVVGFFPNIDVIDDPGCNAANWNLHERDIRRTEDGWRVNGVSLLFFHFSSYQFSAPGKMSKHQDRFNLKEMPDLDALFALFRERVAAHGDADCATWPYTYAVYRGGRRISDHMRRAYRLTPPDRRPADPFDASAHSLKARFSAMWQAVVWLVGKVAGRIMGQRQVEY